MAKTKNDKKLEDELSYLFKSGFSNNESSNLEDSIVDSSLDKYKNDSNVEKIDFKQMDTKFRIQAKGIIDSMYDFYLGFGIIDKTEYLKNKSELDSMNISNMFLQLNTTKMVVEKLLDEINSGNLNPRLIESYCNLNSQLSEMIRSQANYVLFLEESYKKTKIENIERSSSNIQHSAIESHNNDNIKYEEITDSDSEYFITSDPESLIREITDNNELSTDDVKDLRSDYLKKRGDISKYINPIGKDKLIEEYDVDPTTLESDDDQDDYSDMDEMI